MQRYFPDRALRNSVQGHTTLRCLVTSKGQLVNCVVVSEDPADQGFGAAALQTAKLFRMKPQTVGGQPTDGGTFILRQRWDPPKE